MLARLRFGRGSYLLGDLTEDTLRLVMPALHLLLVFYEPVSLQGSARSLN